MKFLKLTLPQLLCLCVGMMVVWSPAAAKDQDYRGTHAIGGTAGFAQGLGLSYRHWFETNGFQVVAFPVVSVSEERSNLLLSGGGSWFHALWQGPGYSIWGLSARNMVHSYLGANVIMERIKDPEWGDNSMRTDVGLGGGLALQMTVGRMMLDFGLGYGGRVMDFRDWQQEDYNGNYVPYDNSGTEFLFLPVIDASIGFVFGGK